MEGQAYCSHRVREVFVVRLQMQRASSAETTSTSSVSRGCSAYTDFF